MVQSPLGRHGLELVEPMAKRPKLTEGQLVTMLKRAVHPGKILRFDHWFGVDPQFWLNLQAQYELALAEQSVGAKIRDLPTAAGDL